MEDIIIIIIVLCVYLVFNILFAIVFTTLMFLYNVWLCNDYFEDDENAEFIESCSNNKCYYFCLNNKCCKCCYSNKKVCVYCYSYDARSDVRSDVKFVLDFANCFFITGIILSVFGLWPFVIILTIGIMFFFIAIFCKDICRKLLFCYYLYN